ncbi:MAG: nitrite reductase small subunit NirD [Rhodococcus sp. (in: high G+C Gram-positive bacteria)]|jgi:nitrite reductase (NADH) small subunit|uniref:nitrite reductase small subunit NirD n=1 Tax=Rhodococcus sp. EPR-157 TaxID=1813677 RepID=UPI0007BB3795|nr:nitrite reductase small subunit NirD [Rhodococcus sp. EPR-157]KZF12889.1 nitrite reductase small subunit [Rhodococcus sp. EPR-157]
MTVIDNRTNTTAQSNATHTAREWTAACTLESLVPGRGVGVLLRGGTQAALFLLPGGALFAVGNIDPFGRAAVMSRGIVGDRGGEPTVASPLLKQVFSLVDGRCLDDDTVGLGSFETELVDGVVYVRGATP